MKAIPCPIHKLELEQLYLKEKKTDREIAEHLGEGATPKRVASWRKRFGIRPLQRWERNEVAPIEGRLRSLLVGSMLGDGRLVRRPNATHFIENHQEAQRKYLEWKVKIWGSWVKMEPKSVSWKKKNKVYEGVRFYTVSHDSLNSWHNLFYSRGGPKSLVQEIVDYVDELALAIWYLDDGYAGWWPCFTFGMDPESRKIAWSIFEKFELCPRWETKKGNTGNFHMEREDTAEKFLESIDPHVPACMSYKLDDFGFQGPHKQIRDKLSPEVLREHAEKGTPIRRIARLLGVGASTVSRHLDKHGIPHPRTKGNPLHRGQ